MSTTTLTADKIRQLNELVNVKKLSDLTDAPNLFDGADSSLLQTTYIPSTTYIANAKRYVNYKIKLEQLTQYLEHIGLNQIDDIEKNINEILSHLVNNSSGQYIGLTYDETNNTYNIKQEYSQINSYGTWHEDYSYYTYNTLTPGIITSSVLDEYITYTMGRILGVPSTETALSEAIDSVVEFVDWFKDYGKNEDGLRALIDKIDNKDAEIISSYMTADNKNLNLSYAYTVENRELVKDLAYAYTETSYNKLYNAMQNVRPIPGENISIGDDNSINCYIGISDENNTLTINGTKYSLSFNENGKLEFIQYTPITLTNVTSNKNFEYNSGAHTFTLSAKTSKNCTVTDRWEDSSQGGSYSANATISAEVTSFGNTSYTLTVKETDSQGGTYSKTVNINYNMYAYWSTVYDTITDDLSTLDLTDESRHKGATSTNGYPSKIYFTQSDWGTGKYIYFLIKGTTSHSFVMGTGTGDGTMAGGIVNMGTKTRYGNINYTLYRSDAIQTGNCNVKIL